MSIYVSEVKMPIYAPLKRYYIIAKDGHDI